MVNPQNSRLYAMMNSSSDGERAREVLLNERGFGPGRLYVLEGPDGVGKSTLAHAFSERLQTVGVPCELMSFPGKEPGTLGQHVYQLHHRPEEFGITTVDPTSLQVLHVAAHIDAIKRRIGPTLCSGTTVVLDRYWWSTWVYGIELGVSRASLKAMIQLEREHWKHALPDAIFLVHREIPLRAEHDLARFRRLNTLYLDLMAQSRNEKVHTLTNADTVDEEVSRMMALAREPRIHPYVAGKQDRD
jgi:dTMP kinase